MTIEEVYAFGGCNWSNCMRELKLGQNTYQGWQRSGYIPMATQLKIERITKKKLIADVNKKTRS